MSKRIMFAYLGGIGLPILLLPLAMTNTMGGHSFMYISVYFSPIGLLAGLSYSDIRRRYETSAIWLRTAIGLVVFFVSFALIAFLSEIVLTLLETEKSILAVAATNGWIIGVLAAPLFTAKISDKVWTSRTKLR